MTYTQLKKEYAKYVARIQKAHPNDGAKPVSYEKWLYLFKAGLA